MRKLNEYLSSKVKLKGFSLPDDPKDVGDYLVSIGFVDFHDKYGDLWNTTWDRMVSSAEAGDNGVMFSAENSPNDTWIRFWKGGTISKNNPIWTMCGYETKNAKFWKEYEINRFEQMIDCNYAEFKEIVEKFFNRQ